jgi:hypothetical protein
MSDMAEIAAALAEALLTIESVDQASATEFLPALESMSVMALVVPFEQESSYEQMDLSGESIYAKHMQKVEFWCKHDQSNPADTLERARTIGHKAVQALMQHDGDGYTVDRNLEFRERIDSGFVVVANVPWLVAHLYVPLEHEVTL